jgi:methionyl-tRNA formyltransferase
MNIVFLTTEDPIYLPAFFDTVLAEYGSQTRAVFAVPPLYKNQSSLQAARRYWKTFGTEGVTGLALRVGGAKLRRQSIAAVCRRRNVRYEDASDVNAPEFLDELRRLSTDLIVSVSCPQIFKAPLIELPEHGCLNIHGAILPEYRGVMPSFWMLANGERQAGVSIYFVNEQIDAGELCAQRVFDIEPEETLDEFLQRSKAIAAELLLEVLPQVGSGTVARTQLDLEQGSYYSWPDREAVARFRTSGRRLWRRSRSRA